MDVTSIVGMRFGFGDSPSNVAAMTRAIQGIMGKPVTQLVSFLVTTPFDVSNKPVINFLNSGRTNIVALKGLPGVLNEFYFDGHPKAVMISEESLAMMKIPVPSDGIWDPSTQLTEAERQAQQQDYKAKIRSLKWHALQGDTHIQVENLENMKFSTLGAANKVEVSDDTVYANAHIFDLIVKDKKNNVRVVTTFRNSPIITDKCTIIGVGPKTKEMWGKVTACSSDIIVLGDITKDLQPILQRTNKIIQIRPTVHTLHALEDPATWQGIRG